MCHQKKEISLFSVNSFSAGVSGLMLPHRRQIKSSIKVNHFSGRSETRFHSPRGARQYQSRDRPRKRRVKDEWSGFTNRSTFSFRHVCADKPAVFNAFSNGFKLWARGQHVMVEGYTAIFLDRYPRIAPDGYHQRHPFKGNSTKLSFPAIILAPTDSNGSRAKEEIGDQIGAIRYTFDPSEKRFTAIQATYGQALKEQWSHLSKWPSDRRHYHALLFYGGPRA